MFKNILLKLIARRIIRKYKPLVVGVTGSVGKTSTREAIYCVLKSKYKVFRSERNLNTESGLPISVMAIDSIPKSKWLWRIQVVTRAFQLLFGRVDYAEVLVLEYGADKPGDIEYLLSIVKPDVAVLTAVAPTHLESFGTVEAVRREKMKLIEAVADRTKRMYNADLVETVDGISYGIREQAEFRAVEIGALVNPATHEVGMHVKIQSGGSLVPCELRGVLGEAYVSCALAAIAVGQALGIHLVDAIGGLNTFKGKPGHMRVLPGIKRTTIIDDTYNSSPAAVKHAVDTLVKLNGFTRKWIVLGDMLELGAESVKYHREVGEYIARNKEQGTRNMEQGNASPVVLPKVDTTGVIANERSHVEDRSISDEQSSDVFLVTVRTLGKEIASGAKQAGMPSESIFEFDDTESAGKFLHERIQEGDLVLVKGSQSVKMEVVVKAIMAEPNRADELLVRRSFGV